MQSEEASNERARPQRKHRRGLTRIAAACERCRKRKQKCDSKYPCGACQAVGVKCVLSDRLTIVANSNEIDDDESPVEQVRQLRSQIEALTRQLHIERARSRSQCMTEQLPVDLTTADSQDDRYSGFSDHALYDLEHVQQSYFGRILRPTFGSDSQARVEAGDKSSAWSLWKDDHSVNGLAPSTIDTTSLIFSDHNDRLVEVFFEQRWPHLPVLHKPSFMRESFVPFSQGQQVSGIVRFQVLIVLAIASLERNRVDKGSSLPHRQYFDLAVRDLNNVMRANDLDCIQCLLLLCMYGRTEPQAINMWYTTGLAMRIAIGMDLHRAESIRRMGLLQAEMSKRLFWSIYAMDRSMSIYLGRPIAVQDGDITLPFPLQLTDDDLETQTDETVQPRTRPDVKDMSTFIHLLKLRRLNAEIYRVFHSVTTPYLQGQDLDSVRVELYTQLNDWLITAPRYPYTSSMFQSPEWFQNAYHLAIIVMHRPSYAQPSPTIDALQLCADSSISLISGYGSLYAKNKVSYSFVALAAIFMAAVTMLYSLRASPQVRRDLTKQVIETNINSALTLLRGISNGREVAERAAGIVTGLGDAVLALFNHEPGTSDHDTVEQEVDREFLSWFGLKSKVVKKPTNKNVAQRQEQHDAPSSIDPEEPLATLSVDMAWEDLFAQGFGMDTSSAMDFFPHSGF